MAYDKKLEERLDQLITGRKDIHSQKMFGGVGYLLRGNMCFGIFRNDLILRVGEEQAVKALKRKSTKPFDITGRAMKGWLMVKPEGIRSAALLKSWVGSAIAFVSQLPRK